MAADSARREERVVKAAREWRRVYWAWLQRPMEGRDLKKNGENRALSNLLDALQALDEAEKP
jgi:hypothetical protein